MVIDQPNCFNNYLPRIHEQSETHAYQIQIRENSRGTVLVSSGKNGFHTPNSRAVHRSVMDEFEL
jgi:hypothetical protein